MLNPVYLRRWFCPICYSYGCFGAVVSVISKIRERLSVSLYGGVTSEGVLSTVAGWCFGCSVLCSALGNIITGGILYGGGYLLRGWYLVWCTACHIDTVVHQRRPLGSLNAPILPVAPHTTHRFRLFQSCRPKATVAGGVTPSPKSLVYIVNTTAVGPLDFPAGVAMRETLFICSVECVDERKQTVLS